MALAEIFSRFSVLIGPAGGGLTLPHALCRRCSRVVYVLLAPTGKARVRLGNRRESVARARRLHSFYSAGAL